MRRGLTLLVLLAALAPPAARAATPLGHRVDTRVGTDEGAQDFGTGGGAGATYPGATAPFGMVQLSPDTVPGIRNFAGAYTYRDAKLRGFSLTHLSGAGCAGLGDVPILPTTHPIDASPSTPGSYDVDSRYVPSFTHRGEVARPGDYRVHMGGGMAAALTATTRTGALRFSFPATKTASVLFNAGGSAMGDFTSDLRIDPARREVTGTVTSGAFCSNQGRYAVHFAARFDRAFAASGTWTKQVVVPGSTHASDRSTRDQTGVATLQYHRVAGLPDALPGNPTSGAQAGAYATFDTTGRRSVVVKVGLSTASVDGARRNLDHESAGRTFDTVRARATARWERLLNTARVRGGTGAQRKLFTSMLYRALLMPNTMSDVDGAYGGMDGKVHRAKGWTKYGTISGWDVYRSQIPLVAILRPSVASDVVRSLAADYRESGHLPKWPTLQGQNGVMVGDPADLMIAGAHAFGARSYSARAALKAMVDGATRYGVSPNGGYVQRPGLDDYLQHGYVGYERNVPVIAATADQSLVWGTAATTLEYGSADFGIARMAAAIGDRKTCRTFLPRAGAWRKLLDPATKRIRPRYGNGAFATDDGWESDQGFVEGSEAQYQWAVPHDVAGLVGATGGRAAAVERLRTFFTKLNTGTESPYAFLGNEPNLHVPYLFDWVGRPDLGAAVVRRAMRSLYALRPGGYPGNDDGGQMASWWVLNALGVYPAVPGEGVLALGAPLFPHAAVTLKHGTLRIDATGAGATRTHVRGVTLNGRRHGKAWLAWRDVARGGRLKVALGAGGRWGRSKAAAPPSFGATGSCAPLRSSR